MKIGIVSSFDSTRKPISETAVPSRLTKTQS